MSIRTEALGRARALILSIPLCLLCGGAMAWAEEAKEAGKVGVIEALKAKAEEVQKAEAASTEAPAAAEPPKEAPKEAPKETPKATPKTEGPAPEPAKEAAAKEAAAMEAALKAAPAKLEATARKKLLEALKSRKVVLPAGVKVEAKAGSAEVVVEGTAAPEDAKAEEPEAAEGGPGEAKAAKEEPKEPMIPMFRLRDGTRLAGTPALEIIHVSTAYGKLVIPVSEVLRVRFASAKDPTVGGKVAEYVKALGSEEYDTREEATEKLREIGLPALDALKAALQSEDAEVKTRAEKLVAEIEETVEEEDPETAHLSAITGEDDEVVTLQFTVLGRIEEDEVSVSSRYGDLKLSRNDIVSIVFREAPVVRRTFQVPGGTFAAGNKWVVTDLELTQGESLHISASGTINIESHGQTCGPEGTTNIGGNQFQSFPSGSLVARIGDKGKPFQVGAQYDGEANATGKLQLSVSLQQGQVSGEFTVEVEVEEAQ